MERRLPATTASGAESRTDGYVLVSRLFLKALALVYLAAFLSLAGQITALAGSAGIFPLDEQLAAHAAAGWLERLLRYPSLFWFAAGDHALQAAAWFGVGFAVMLLFGWFERLSLVALFLLYLSLFHAGQLFMNFQWDYLLLEAGFLGIFLPGRAMLVIWLFRWLLFRLRLLSGVSKLVSGDAGWSGLTALTTYFETQPLPHVGAWYAHQLPDWLLRFGTGATLFVELVVPFFFFLPRRWRLTGAALTILWQLLIIATSNHNFFNLLTIALCLFLLDDRALAAMLPGALRRRWQERAAPAGASALARGAALIGALVIVPVSLLLAADMVSPRPLPPVLAGVVDVLRPLHIVNRYHVFPTVDTQRIELQIEGSADGVSWRPYRFRYKPGDPAVAPPFVVPHQPRIDWLMWFVPKSPVFLPWFDRFLDRLLAGEPAVLAQLGENPFPDGKPQALRVRAYRYRFTDAATRAATGNWWVREPLGPFLGLPGRRERR
ncbi:MAG: lipase maturation factor family protein [Gammaproteobacteria bacterium]